MDFSKLILYAAGIFLLIKGLQYSLVWIKLMRERHQVSKHEWIEPHEIPEKFTPVWTEADQALSSLGFQYAYAQKTTIGNQDLFYYIYVHPTLAVFANASPTLLSSGTRSFDVIFSSILENGELVVTTDCLNNIELPYSSNIHCQTLFLGDLPQHYQAHIALVNQLKTSKQAIPIYCTVDTHLAIENHSEQTSFSYRVAQGLVVPIGTEQVWRYSAIGAIKMLWPIFKAAKKLSNVTKTNATKALTNPSTLTSKETTANAQLVASVTAFERILEDENRRQAWGWMTKAILFVVSVVVTAIAFGLTFSWKIVPMFLGILFIHELGHLVGMKMFGYKDTQILFLPFLGAVTIGEKENVTPMQKLVIYLLGPVPGVIGGFIAGYIYTITGEGFWYEIALMPI
ncbi:MAG: peptidase M50, partial [bacterium]